MGDLGNGTKWANRIGQILAPVVVIQGDRDEFIQLEHAKYIARSLGNARFELLEGLGRFAPIQDPATFNEVLLRCLSTIPETTPSEVLNEA